MQHLSLGNDVLQSDPMVKIEKLIVLIQEDSRRLNNFLPKHDWHNVNIPQIVLRLDTITKYSQQLSHANKDCAIKRDNLNVE